MRDDSGRTELELTGNLGEGSECITGGKGCKGECRRSEPQCPRTALKSRHASANPQPTAGQCEETAHSLRTLRARTIIRAPHFAADTPPVSRNREDYFDPTAQSASYVRK